MGATSSSLPTPFFTLFKPKEWKDGTPEEYRALFKALLTGTMPCTTPAAQRARNCLISLAKTSPEAFAHEQGDYRPIFGDLSDSLEASIWVAANFILGSHWSLHAKPTKHPPYLPKPTKSTTRVGFALPAPSTKSTSAGLFIHHTNRRPSRAPEDPITRSTKLAKRKHATFFTLVLPELASSNSGLAQEALASLHDALSIIWSTDPRLALYVFPTKTTKSSHSKPIVSLPLLDDPSYNRSAMEHYTPQLWLRKERRPYIRFFIGHEVLASTILSTATPKLDSRDSMLKIDPIQAPSTTICGWLLGTHRSFDLLHYSEILNSIPRFADHPVALSSRLLKVYSTEKIRKGNEVYAVHLLCDATKRTSTNLLLKAQYNRLNPRDLASLPDGKIFRYITYKGNRDDLMPLPGSHNNLQLLRARQQQFQEMHATAPIRGVIDLDLPLELGSDGLLTLRQILLAARCQANLSHPLLLSVDFNPYRNEITALFHRGNEVEALRLLSALPVFLEAKYNTKIWTWFTADLKIELSTTKWDPVNQCLEEAGDDEEYLMTSLYGTDTLADWEEVDSLNVPAVPTESIMMDLSLLFNMAPRSGGTGFDDNASLSTMKTGTSNATQIAARAPLDEVGHANDANTVDSSITNSKTSASTSEASGQGAGVDKENG